MFFCFNNNCKICFDLGKNRKKGAALQNLLQNINQNKTNPHPLPDQDPEANLTRKKGNIKSKNSVY